VTFRDVTSIWRPKRQDKSLLVVFDLIFIIYVVYHVCLVNKDPQYYIRSDGETQTVTHLQY